MKDGGRIRIAIVLLLGISVAILYSFFIDFYRVPSDLKDPRSWANAPTLEPGDLVLVWRHITPHSGDLVRCPDPAEPKRWLVGRVVGMQGDRIELVDGSLKINGFRIRTHSCDSLPRTVKDSSNEKVTLTCQLEEFGGSTHEIYMNSAATFPETTVASGSVFLLSDNRLGPWSYDSRIQEVLQIPISSCEQRLVVRLWSKHGWSDSVRRMTFLF